MFRLLFNDLLRKSRAVSDGVGSPALAFVPALTLASFWWGGEVALVAVALGLPLFIILAGYLPAPPRSLQRDVKDRPLDSIARLETALDQAVTHYVNGSKNSACVDLVVVPQPSPRQAAALGSRLKSSLRFGDVVAQRGQSTFTACIQATENLTDDSAWEIARRLQRAVARPVFAEGKSQAFQATVGYCTARNAPDVTASSVLEAAGRAAQAAQRQGVGILRSYEASMGGQTLHGSLVQEVQIALSNGQIHPWFQPQFDAKTGKLSGMEALVRWVHPAHGTVPPNEFLSAVRQAGQWDVMTDLMLNKSLDALVEMDRCGINVPTVGVNFAQDDLTDVNLPDRIAWALDRTGLNPDRLTVEVLESVVAGGTDGKVQENLKRISMLGCRIDLDDFGTGHASIASLRDYSLHRVKIDRSYIEEIDGDSNQKAMFETILMMANRLGFDTLAEGVETQDQLDVLRALGCGHVQGFGLAKPMPLMDLELWLADHATATKRKAANG